MNLVAAKQPMTRLDSRQVDSDSRERTSNQCGLVSFPGRIGAAPRNKVDSFPSIFSSLPPPTINSFLLSSPRADSRVVHDARRQKLLCCPSVPAVRPRGSQFRGLSVAGTDSPSPLLSRNVQLTNWNSSDVRFAAMLPLPMTPLPSSRARRALMYVASHRKPFVPAGPVRTAQSKYLEILPRRQATYISDHTNTQWS